MMEEVIDVLVRNSAGCLSDSVVKILRNLSLKVIRGVAVREDAYIVLPNGLVAVIPSTQLPDVWFNILHVYCFRDYSTFEEFIPKAGWVVIDVGAFIGLYTLYASNLVGNSGVIVALEPASLPRKYLQMNVEVNDLSNVVIDGRALTPEEGVFKLYVTGYWATSSIVREYAEYMGSVVKVEYVRGTTLKELLRDHDLGYVDLIKLDIEGAERTILKSSIDLLRSDAIKRLVIEVHRGLSSCEEITKLLRESGYRVSIHDPGLENQLFVYASKGP